MGNVTPHEESDTYGSDGKHHHSKPSGGDQEEASVSVSQKMEKDVRLSGGLEAVLSRGKFTLHQSVPRMDPDYCIREHQKNKNWLIQKKALNKLFRSRRQSRYNDGDDNTFARTVWESSDKFDYQIGSGIRVRQSTDHGGWFSTDRTITISGEDVRMRYSTTGGWFSRSKAQMIVTSQDQQVGVIYQSSNHKGGFLGLCGTKTAHNFRVNGAEFEVKLSGESGGAEIFKDGSHVGDMYCRANRELHHQWHDIERSDAMRRIQEDSARNHAFMEAFSGNFFEAAHDWMRESSKCFDTRLTLKNFELSLKKNLTSKERLMLLAAIVFLRETGGYRHTLYVKEQWHMS